MLTPGVIHAHQLHGAARHPLHGAKLTFYIKEGLLTGHAGGHHVQILAWSGGGGGSKSGWIEKGVVNNPAMVTRRTSGAHHDHLHHHHGGPIPPGTYTIGTPTHHPHIGLSAVLIPSHSNHMFHRDGFLIHGRGPHGSDGCIVPHSAHDFQHLMTALTHDHGGVLTVLASHAHHPLHAVH